MKQLITLVIEFFLIILVAAGIYYVNLSKKFNYPYKYNKPILAMRTEVYDEQLRTELIFFLVKELGLYEGEFKMLDVVYLYTDKISGADYILVTLEAPDGKLCQLIVSRSFLPYSKWELNPESFNVIEPMESIGGFTEKVPKWMQDLGVTSEQLNNYYTAHPDVALKGESAFFDEKTGGYNLPSDWYKTMFTFEIKEKGIRLIPETTQKGRTSIVNSYWKVDYPSEYLGPGYREYLYRKIKD